ncbi:MAG: hypothetical protein ACTSR9_19260 [Candidatus Thorarchaeota archaeon]
MSNEELLEKVRHLEQVGVLRALLFLRDGKKTTREFEEIMSSPTWTKSARPLLLELGLIEMKEGERRKVIHSLTETGQQFADLLVKLLDVF